MSLQQTLDSMSTTLQKASSLPLSASCVVNRIDMLTLVEEARGSVPREMRAAANVLAHREQLIGDAQEVARRTVTDAELRAGELVSDSVIVGRAQLQAAEILTEARDEAARLLRDADDYCERRLAEFEDDLTAATAQVRRGRDRLRARVAEADRLAALPEEPLLGQEPEEEELPPAIWTSPAATDPVTEDLPVVTVPAAEASAEEVAETSPEPEASPESEASPEPSSAPEISPDRAADVRREILEIDLRDPEPVYFAESEPAQQPLPFESAPEEEDEPVLLDLTALERTPATAGSLRDRLFPSGSGGARWPAAGADVGEDDIYVPGGDEPFDQRAPGRFPPGDNPL